MLLGDDLGEVLPVCVDHDAAECQNMLGALAAPAHARAIEPSPDAVLDGALDRAGGDVQVFGDELLVGLPFLTSPNLE